MQKKSSKLTILVSALILLCGITIGANAADTIQEIKAHLDSGITVTLEGQAQTFTDANGMRVFPITYNGTTYLPVRAVAGLVGLDVSWDQTTKTVALNAPKGIDMIDTYKYYHVGGDSTGGAKQVQTENNKTFTISGVDCSHWFEIWTGYGEANKVSFNIGSKYNSLTFKYYSDNDCTLRVLGDNDTVLFETAIKAGQIAQTAIDVNLFKAGELSFECVNSHCKLYVFDAYLDA